MLTKSFLLKAGVLEWAAVTFCAVLIASVVSIALIFQPHQPGTPAQSPPANSAPSDAARHDIPPNYLALYQQAAGDCPGLPWSVLAGIGKVETDHGRSSAPGVHSGENYARAGGPMQFLEPTFDGIVARHPLPPGGSIPPSRYNPSDAIHASAHYLCESGAPADIPRAIFTYNHADWYVREVLDQATAYAQPAGPGSGDCRDIHAASPAANAAITFACAQLGQPYVWGGEGPANGGFDCSGLVKAAYAVSGIILPRVAQDQFHAGPPIPENQLQPGDLVFYGVPENIHHVGMYVGNGLMVNAPDFNIPVRVQPYRYPGDDYFGATRPANLPPAPVHPQL